MSLRPVILPPRRMLHGYAGKTGGGLVFQDFSALDEPSETGRVRLSKRARPRGETGRAQPPSRTPKNSTPRSMMPSTVCASSSQGVVMPFLNQCLMSPTQPLLTKA